MTDILNGLIWLIIIAIFARVILSFVLPMIRPPHHPLLVNFTMLVNQITEPLLRPLRRVLPSFGGFDFSPTVVLLILFLIQDRVLR